MIQSHGIAVALSWLRSSVLAHAMSGGDDTSGRVVAALIGAGATLISALIGAYRNELIALLSRHGRRLSGVWVGDAREVDLPEAPSHPPLIEFSFTMELKQRGRRITGTVSGTGRERDPYKERVSGYLEDDDYVTLSFRAVSPQMRDYGVAMLHVHGTSRKMDGYGLAKRIREPGFLLVRTTITKRSDEMP